MNNEETKEEITPEMTDREAKSDEDVRSQQAKDAEAVTGDMNDIDDIAFEEVNEEGEVNARDTIKKLRAKVKELEAEAKNNLDGWTRAKADYANFKREVDARRLDDIKLANRRLIEDMLPALDAYTMAQSNKEAWEKVDAGWRTGVEYIFNQLKATLEKEGLVAYGVPGETFDPNIHDSIEVIKEEDASQHDTIAEVLAQGYKLGSYILRPAKVKVFG
jgi:molecular chaperone GrpE